MSSRGTKVLAALYFLSGMLWISARSWYLIEHNPQSDFLVYYCAGLSVREGYSPYANNMDKDMRTWDHRDTGFIQDPIAARLFVPLSRLSYARGKLVWTSLIMLCVAGALTLATYLVWPQGSWVGLLTTLGAVFWYYPTFLEIEYGNINSLTLFVISLGFALAYRYRRAWAYCALGACLAFAAVLKWDALLFMPGIFLTRWRPVLVGFFSGIIVLGGISLVKDGPSINQDYFFHRIGGILEHERSWNADDMAMIPKKLPRYIPGMSSTDNIDGVVYNDQNITLEGGSASGTYEMILYSHVPRLLILIVVPLLIWGVTFIFVRGGTALLDPVRAFYYFGLLITLFCAPFTWHTRLFWVVPLLPWVAKKLFEVRTRLPKIYLLLCIFCIEIIGLPVFSFRGDSIYYPLLFLMLMAFIWKILTLSKIEMQAFAAVPLEVRN